MPTPRFYWTETRLLSYFFLTAKPNLTIYKVNRKKKWLPWSVSANKPKNNPWPEQDLALFPRSPYWGPREYDGEEPGLWAQSGSGANPSSVTCWLYSTIGDLPCLCLRFPIYKMVIVTVPASGVVRRIDWVNIYKALSTPSTWHTESCCSIPQLQTSTVSGFQNRSHFWKSYKS